MKERDRIKLADADFVGFGTAAKTRGKRSGWKKLARRAAAGLLAMSIVMTTALADMSVTAWAAEGDTTAAPAPEETTQGAGNGDTRVADAPTWESYLTDGKMTLQGNSMNSGRVWTDKSVFTETQIKDESDPLSGQLGTDEFMEVFSALGSSQQYSANVPADTVIVIDNSGSMYSTPDKKTWEGTRISKTVEAVNFSIDMLMRANDENRVSVVLFGDGSVNGEKDDSANTAKVIIPMDHYPTSAVSGQPLEYLKAGWKTTNGQNENSGDSPNHTTRESDSGYVYVNHEALQDRIGGYTAYANGTTNIQAGLYTGMLELIEASKDKETNMMGVPVKRIPRMIFVTDGQATDTISFDSTTLNMSSMSSNGFVNDLTNDLDKSFAKVCLNQFVKKIDGDKYELYVNPSDYGEVTLDGSKMPESRLKIYNQYKLTQEYIILSTLMTAGYLKGQVEKAYGTLFCVSTISIDMTEPKPTNSKTSEFVTTNGALMDPQEYFNTTWSDQVTPSKSKQSGSDSNTTDYYTRNYAIKEAVGEAYQKYADWKTTGEMEPIPYLTVTSSVNLSAYISDDENKNKIEGYPASIKDMGKNPAETPYGVTTHGNFWVVEEQGLKDIPFVDITDDERRAFDVNYVDRAYWVNTSNGASNAIAETFEDIINEMSQSIFSPINPAYGQYMTYTDPIGQYMEVGDHMTVEVFGEQYTGELVQDSADSNKRVFKFDITKNGQLAPPQIYNPAYAYDLNGDTRNYRSFYLDQIQISVEKEPTTNMQILTVKIPSMALPLWAATLVRSKDSTLTDQYEYVADQDTPPLRVYYKVGITENIKDPATGTVDLNKVDEAYLNSHTVDQETGEVRFYTNDWQKVGEGTVTTDVVTSFNMAGDNRYYQYPDGGAPYYDPSAAGDPLRVESAGDAEARMDENNPKTDSSLTGTYVNAYEPEMPQSGSDTVTEKLGNNGFLRVKPAGLLLTKEVSNDNDDEKGFQFLLQLSKQIGGQTVAYTASPLRAVTGTWNAVEVDGGKQFASNSGTTEIPYDAAEGGYSVTLKSGEGILLRYLPEGYTCTVKEILPQGDSVAGGTVYYKLEKVEATGGETCGTEQNGLAAMGVLKSGETNRLEFHFTNKKYFKASLTGTKKVTVMSEGDDESENMDSTEIPNVFSFEIRKGTGNPVPDPVTGEQDAKTVGNVNDTITFFEDAEFEWGRPYTYDISEKDNPDIGYEMDKASYHVEINLENVEASVSVEKSGVASDAGEGESGPGTPSTQDAIEFINKRIPGPDVILRGKKKLIVEGQEGSEKVADGGFVFEIIGVSRTNIEEAASPTSLEIDEPGLDETEEFDDILSGEPTDHINETDEGTETSGDSKTDSRNETEDRTGSTAGNESEGGKGNTANSESEDKTETTEGGESEDETETTAGDESEDGTETTAGDESEDETETFAGDESEEETGSTVNNESETETDNEADDESGDSNSSGGEYIARALSGGTMTRTAAALTSGFRTNILLSTGSGLRMNIIRAAAGETKENVKTPTETEADEESEERKESKESGEGSTKTRLSSKDPVATSASRETLAEPETGDEKTTEAETKNQEQTEAETTPDQEEKDSSGKDSSNSPSEENQNGQPANSSEEMTGDPEESSDADPDLDASLQMDDENEDEEEGSFYRVATDSNAEELVEEGGQRRKRATKRYSQEQIRKLANEAAEKIIKTWPEEQDEDVPLPSETTVKNDADGSFTFGSIHFEDPGIYTYAVREIEPDEHNRRFTYDKEIYTVVVTVERLSKVAEDPDDGSEEGEDNGEDCELELKVTSVIVKDSNGNEVGSYDEHNAIIELHKDGEYAFTNTIKDEKVSVTVTKKWTNDYGNKLNTRPESVQVKLMRASVKADGTAPDPADEASNYQQLGDDISPVSLNETNNWTYTWDGLDRYVGLTDTEYAYWVEEVAPPAGYKATIEPPLPQIPGPTEQPDAGGNTYVYTYTITNRYEDNNPKIRLRIKKEWLDHGGRDSERNLSVTVRQWKDEACTVSSGNEWTYTLNEASLLDDIYKTDTWFIDCWSSPVNGDGKKDYLFDKYWTDEAGENHLYYYTAEEIVNWIGPDGEQYVQKKRSTLTVTSPDGSIVHQFCFENSYDPKVDITVEKVWENDTEAVNFVRPDSIQVQLYRSAGGLAEQPYGDVQTLTESDNWTYTWWDLDEYPDGNSKMPYTYSVKEVNVPKGYIESYAPNNTGGHSEHDPNKKDEYRFKITNTFQEEKVSITVNKAWANDEGWESLRPDEIRVQLLQNGKPYGGSGTSGGEGGDGETPGAGPDVSIQTLTKQGNGEWTSAIWSNLPKWEYTKDSNGNVDRELYEYTVQELNDQTTGSYYDPTYSEVVWDPDYMNGTVTITNTLRTALIRVAKWVDNAKDHVADAPDIMDDEFIVEVDGEGYKFHTGLRLQHAAEEQSDTTLDASKYSGYLKVPVSSDGTTLYIKETAVPKEYKPSEVYYTYADGTNPKGTPLVKDENGRYLIEITADMATVDPVTGQIPEIVVVVHNTFEHDHYFHNDASVDNDFGSQEKKNDIPTGSASRTALPTASLPPASSEDRRVKVATLDIDERLV